MPFRNEKYHVIGFVKMLDQWCSETVPGNTVRSMTGSRQYSATIVPYSSSVGTRQPSFASAWASSKVNFCVVPVHVPLPSRLCQTLQRCHVRLFTLS